MPEPVQRELFLFNQTFLYITKDWGLNECRKFLFLFLFCLNVAGLGYPNEMDLEREGESPLTIQFEIKINNVYR